MSECMLRETCSFFNDRMPHTPGSARLLKNRYCLHDNSLCARYIVFKALGREKVPSDLFPNDLEKATEILFSG